MSTKLRAAIRVTLSCSFTLFHFPLSTEFLDVFMTIIVHHAVNVHVFHSDVHENLIAYLLALG